MDLENLPDVQAGLAAAQGRAVCPACGPRPLYPLTIGERTYHLPVMCQHQEAEAQAIARAREERQELMTFRSRFGRYDVPEEYARLTLADIDPERPGSQRGLAFARYYLENWGELEAAGRGLILHGIPTSAWDNPGSPGTGKTLTAAVLAAELERQGVSVAWFVVKDLFEALRDFDRKAAVLDCLRAARLLVLDELVSERDTAWAVQELFTLIDARYAAQRPTILTTNFERGPIARHYERVLTRGNDGHPLEVAQVMVRRLLSRLQPPRFVWVPFDGPDQRLAQNTTWGPDRPRKEDA
jgi:DNA replication protein DnaC